MAYDDKQEAWLTKTVSAVSASEEALVIAKARDEGQKLIAQELASQKMVIRQTFASIDVEMQANSFREILREKVGLANKMALMDPGHDPMKEIDSWHDLPQAKSLPPEVVRAIITEYSKIIEVQRKLLENDCYREPELSDPPTAEELDAQKDARRRLAEDLWKPLEREGIIPENFVPDEYSEVSRTFLEANAFYEERLAEYTEELGEFGAFFEKFDVALSVGQGLLKVATAGADLTAAAGALADSSSVVKDAAEAKEILEWVGVGLSAGAGIVKGALQERDGIAVADALNIYVSKVLETTLSEEVAGIVTGAVEASIRATASGKKFAEGDFEGGLSELGDAISGGLSAADQSDGKKLALAGDIISRGLKGLANAGPVKEKIKNGDYRGALSVVIQNLDSVVTEAEGELMDFAKELDEDLQGIEDQQAVIGAKFDQAALEAKAKEAAQMQREQFDEFMRQEDRAFGEALEYGFADPDGDEGEIEQSELKRLESIERLIAVQKRNQMMFDLSKKISAGGISLVGKFVPGMSLVAAAQQLAYSIAEAIKHTRQLLIWMDNVSDAGKAATVQLDAMMNRYGLEKKQTLQANINVAIDAIRVCGEACKLAGEAAPVGFVVVAAADTAAASFEVACEIFEIAQMEMAWRDYKKALANPKDRKAIRQTLRSNPTLAKYAMAYGAVEDNNPIAQEAMRRCGLNERTLAQRETNVGKVVEYLETVYRDDPVLLRAVPPKDAWHPSGEPQLTFRSWIAYYTAATTKAEPKLAKSDVSKINALLDALSTANEAFETAVLEAKEANKSKSAEELADAPEMPDPAVLSTAKSTAEKVRVAFSAFKSVGEDEKPHEEMARYVDAMSAKAKIQMDSIDKITTTQVWLQV